MSKQPTGCVSPVYSWEGGKWNWFKTLSSSILFSIPLLPSKTMLNKYPKQSHLFFPTSDRSDYCKQ